MDQNTLKKMPLGLQEFTELRYENCLYVDKTDLMWQFVHDCRFNFLSRPRRFGKSLLLSTIQAYFEGRKELFEGLRVMELETEWQSHPVLRFDLGVGEGTPTEFRNNISSHLSRWENQYHVEEKFDETAYGTRLQQIIRAAYDQTGQRVVVLVDEYDSALQNSFFNDEAHDEIRGIYRNLFVVLKANEPYLKFVLFTGITRFTGLSIFSVLNNITNQTFNPKYESICGISEDELHTVFDLYIEQLANKQKWTKDEAYRQLKQAYNGFHFTDEFVDIYNPYSLINALYTNKIRAYWVTSGSTRMLTEWCDRMEGNQVATTDWEHITLERDMVESSDLRRDNLPLFLQQTGYLTIKDADSAYYTLGFPNDEVKRAFYEILLPRVLQTPDGNDVSNHIKLLKEALYRGQYDSAFDMLKSLIASMPYAQDKKETKVLESRFQFALELIFCLCGYHVTQEVEVAGGRIDILAESQGSTLVIETKVSNGPQADIASKLKEAKDQIVQNAYCEPYKAFSSVVIPVALVFSAVTRGLAECWYELP